MKTFRGTLNFEIKEPSAIAIGKFDGLHKGHELLLSALSGKKKEGLLIAAFTFDTPPLGENGKVLSTLEEKEALFREAGIDVLIECPFTEEVMRMEPEAFLSMLREKCNVRCIAAGTDCRFGYQRRGDAEMLLSCQKRFGYEAVIVDKIQWKGQDISSTLIRNQIEEGRLKEAEELLGYPYYVTGEVIHGNQIGRTLGIPTLNLRPPEEKLLPPFGVYVSETLLDGKIWPGISNVGVKPTIEGEAAVGAETFLFDYDGDAYGHRTKTSFLHFLRPERQFSSMKELTEEMKRNILSAKTWFQSRSL